MPGWNIYTPDGVRDILFDECFAKRNLEEKLRKLFYSCGYKEIETPTLEFYDVFSEAKALLSQETMFKYFDQQGRILVLRPDTTVPVARVSATKLENSAMPARISYIENTFRYNEHGGGKQKEFTAAGVEIIGEACPEADAEAVVMAIKAAKKCGIESLQIDIGQVEFFKGLMEQSGLSLESIDRVVEFIDNKDLMGLESELDGHVMDQSTRKLILDLPSLFGGYEVIDRALAAVSEGKCRNALLNLKQIYEVLTDYELDKYVSIDLGLVQNMNFYTGMVFKGFTYDIGFSILRGGRYDNLVSTFGKELPATGFSLGLNMVMIALERQKIELEKPKVDTIISGPKEVRKTVYKIWEELKRQGLNVEMDFCHRSSEELIEYAKIKKIGGFILLDKQSGISVFNTDTGECVNTSIAQLIGREIEGGKL